MDEAVAEELPNAPKGRPSYEFTFQYPLATGPVANEPAAAATRDGDCLSLFDESDIGDFDLEESHLDEINHQAAAIEMGRWG